MTHKINTDKPTTIIIDGCYLLHSAKVVLKGEIDYLKLHKELTTRFPHAILHIALRHAPDTLVTWLNNNGYNTNEPNLDLIPIDSNILFITGQGKIYSFLCQLSQVNDVMVVSLPSNTANRIKESNDIKFIDGTNLFTACLKE